MSGFKKGLSDLMDIRLWSFAQATAKSIADKNTAKQICKKYRTAGRTDVEFHKSSMCLYDAGIPQQVEVLPFPK